MSISEPEKTASRAGSPAAGSLRIKVVFTGPFESLTGHKEQRIELPAGSTLGYLLLRLAERYGSEFENYVFIDRDTLSHEALILVNGLNAGSLQGLKTPLNGDPEAEVEVGFLGPLPVGG